MPLTSWRTNLISWEIYLRMITQTLTQPHLLHMEKKTIPVLTLFNHNTSQTTVVDNQTLNLPCPHLPP